MLNFLLSRNLSPVRLTIFCPEDSILRSLSIFALLAASASFASAATVSFTCTAPSSVINPVGLYTAGAGTIDYSCSGFSAASGFEITAVTLTGEIDYTFASAPSNTFQVSWTTPGGFSPSPLVVQQTGPESSGPSVTGSTSLLSGLPVTSFSSFTSTGTGSTPVGSVSAGTGILTVTYTYEAQQQNGDVPEPSTLALVGGVLVLAGIRKFRR